MSDRKKNITWYLISDYIFSVITLVVFVSFLQSDNIDRNFLYRILLISAGWILFYAFAGSYHRSLYEKSRLNELTSTLVFSFTGCLLLTLLPVEPGINSISSFTLYFLLQFSLVFTGRSFLLYRVKKALVKGDIFF